MMNHNSTNYDHCMESRSFSFGSSSKFHPKLTALIYRLWFIALLGLFLFPLLHTSACLASSNIDDTDKWAWATDAGWVNFKPMHGGVTVYDSHLEGYAWAENIGWIRLGTHVGGGTHIYVNTSADNYGVNQCCPVR